MRRLIQSLSGSLRFCALLLGAVWAYSASADYLYWTVDFTDDLGNEGKLNSNPAGSGASGYDIYLGIYNEATKSYTYILGGSLIDDVMYDTKEENYWVATDVEEFSMGDGYSFFVEMVNSGKSASDWSYRSPSVKYASLGGHIGTELSAIDSVWNGAVGGPWMIPEPTSGTLLLLGFGFLMLKRKNKLIIGRKGDV